MADKEMQQLEQIKELISTAKKLTVQLINLEVHLEANKNCAAGTLVQKSNSDDKQALRTYGYVNWNSSHDILKTTRWKKMSEFTEYCGLVERGGVKYNFGTYINMDISEYVVSEEIRFREDNLFLNMSSPLVWAEILYIKELRKPTPELVKQFLDTVKNDMHTRSSFEEKYGLKWVEPDSEACAMSASMHELKPLAPILSPIDEQETGNNDLGTTKVIPVTSSLREDVEPRKEDSSEEPVTLNEECPKENSQKALELYEFGSAEEPTFSKENLVEGTQKTLKPNEVDSAKQPIIFRENNLDEIDQKILVLKEMDLAKKTIIISEHYPHEDDQKTLELKEVNSAENPVIFNKENPNEDALKALDLKEGDLAEKPTTFSEENPDEDDVKTLELYENFSVILQKVCMISYASLDYCKLLKEVEELGISNEKRLGIVVDLLFEKAIEEPEFSKGYADFCNELVTLKVPSDNNSDKSILFRGLLIRKCQNEFEEKLLSNDPKETDVFQMVNNEEIRRTRVVATVRFIGELYKHNILTCHVMDYCLEKLTEKLEEEKLECLCELLTIIGQKMERQGSSMLLTCLKKMEELVVSKSNTISSHVKLMVKDVVDLGRSRWVFRSFVDSQLKKMAQIQLEAEQRTHLIQQMNVSDGEQGGQGSNSGGDNSFMSIMFPRARSLYYSVDTLLLIADMQESQNYIKLPPACFKNISKNMFSILEKFQADPTAHRDMITVNRDTTPTCPLKSASIEGFRQGSEATNTKLRF